MNSFHLLQLTDNLPSFSTYFFPVFSFPHLYLFLVLVSFCCCCSFSSFIVLLFPLVAACTISRPFLLVLFLVKRAESFAENRWMKLSFLPRSSNPEQKQSNCKSMGYHYITYWLLIWIDCSLLRKTIQQASVDCRMNMLLPAYYDFLLWFCCDFHCTKIQEF